HAAWLHVAPAARGLPRGDPLAPRSPLRERRSPSRAARYEHRAGHPRLALPDRSRRAGGADRGGGRGAAGRALLRTRVVGDCAGSRQLPPARRPGGLGSGGDAVNRALDVAFAGAGLLVASPVLGVAALAIKLGNGGPVLYRQCRVGKDGADFELLKLRTMV